MLAVYGELPDSLRKVAGTLLAGRPASAAAMLQAVDDGKLAAGLVSAEVISLLRSHRDEGVGQLLTKHFADSEVDAAELEQDQVGTCIVPSMARSAPGRYSTEKTH